MAGWRWANASPGATTACQPRPPGEREVSLDEQKPLSYNELRPTKELFRTWSRCRDGTITRRSFERLMPPIRRGSTASCCAGCSAPTRGCSARVGNSPTIGRGCGRSWRPKGANRPVCAQRAGRPTTLVHPEGTRPFAQRGRRCAAVVAGGHSRSAQTACREAASWRRS